MKAYRYSTTSGIYEGEVFENAEEFKRDEGVTHIPPPDYDRGQVPVYDLQKSSWTVIPVAIARQLLTSSADSKF